MAEDRAYREVMLAYERDRAGARLRREERRQALYDAAPEVRALEARAAALGMRMMRALLGQGAEGAAVDALKAELGRCVAEKEALLRQRGYVEAGDDYTCAACRDTGYIGAEKCHCLRQRLIEKHYDVSNVRQATAEENFDTFDARYYDEQVDEGAGLSPRANIESVHAACLAFARGLAEGAGGGLLFYGQTGLGKTFLCNCVAKAALDAGQTALYVTAPQIFKKIEQYRFNREELDSPEEQFALIYDCDLLIIDDLGSEFSTVVTTAELFNIINTRMIEKRAVIISTNLSPRDLQEHYSDRIVSRLFGHYKMLRFFGDDIRLKKKMQKLGGVRAPGR